MVLNLLRMRNEILEQFKIELLNIFQFENQDYNLGIIKLLSFKRERIQNFIDKFKPIELSEGLSLEIYNLVINFFSQIYKNGILHPKGRYSSGFANLYNNDGISFNWLNKNQNYVKLREAPNKSGKVISDDYFIHKDLKRFLLSKLNRFIKNEFLSNKALQKLETEDLQEKILKIKNLEAIATQIIEILVQIEDFQLQLWKKKNLILETNYVISLDMIEKYAGGSFLTGIIDQLLKNKEQMKEWNTLFEINISGNPELKNVGELIDSNWKYLPIDTKYFDEGFKWNLVGALSQNNNLDDILDGILIKSDNYQALNLIMKKWYEKVNLIYIDPPFNTGKKEYLYKNDYLDSSWLVMMNDRLNLAHEILHEEGNIFVRIDNNGNHYVRFLLNLVFDKSNFRNEIIINKTRAKKQRKKPFIQQTESLFFYSKSKEYYFNQLQRPRKDPRWFELVDFPRPNENPRIVLGKTYYPPKNRRWGLSQERINEFEHQGKVRTNQNRKYTNCFGDIVEEKPELYYDLEPVRNDWLDIPGYSQVHKFSTENSEQLLKRVIESGSRENDVVLDFFLGSGTTIATAQKLNRKWIGVEIGSQFEDFILPRMKAVLKGDKTGISKALKTTSSGFFKYHYLEQFEDTIENLEFSPQLNKISFDFDEIEDPLDYKIKILENNHQKTKKVDLIETFNYLVGIYIDHIDTSNQDGRTYIFVKGKANKQKIIVIWRSIIGLDLEQDKKIIKNHLNDGNYSYVYINGKSLIENSKSIEMELKKLIWE